jgi:transposase-like protein
MKGVEQDLIGTALPYWEVEATIARRFFKNKPTREDHIFWLKAQLWKELHPVDGYFTGLQKELNNLVASFPEIDKTIDRHRYHSLLEQLTQEFNHYVLMADVLEYLLGHPVSAEDTFQLPQEKKLGDIRRGYASSGSAIDKAAVLVTEGGGARMFREGRKLKGGRLERMIASAMEVVYQDEKNHYKEAAREAARAVRNTRDLARMKKAVHEVSLQRVYMRNEMFKEPLTSNQIKKLVENTQIGKIPRFMNGKIQETS